MTKRFPDVISAANDAINNKDGVDIVLDGEIVPINDKGVI